MGKPTSLALAWVLRTIPAPSSLPLLLFLASCAAAQGRYALDRQNVAIAATAMLRSKARWMFSVILDGCTGSSTLCICNQIRKRTQISSARGLGSLAPAPVTDLKIRHYVGFAPVVGG